jgi:hypothetical protein
MKQTINPEASRSFYTEGNEGLKPLPDFIQINIHIVSLLKKGAQ